MGTITQLCTRAIHLKSGEITHAGDANSVVSKYLMDGNLNNSQIKIIKKEEAGNTKKLFFKKITIFENERIESSEIDVRYPFYLDLEYEITKQIANLELAVRIYTSDGRPVITTCQSDCSPESLGKRDVGTYRASIKFPGMFLMPGSYMVTIAAHEPMVEIFDIHEHILQFKVIETGTKFSKYPRPHEIGVVIAELPWLENKLY
jgi:lipopolysaccharide transport system ATP-binding protein